MKLSSFAMVAVTALAAAAPSQLPVYSVGGSDAGDRFGMAVSGAGDVDGDGFADVVSGAPRDDDNGTDSGSVRVISGRDQSVLFELLGAAAGDEFGAAVAGAGDVNGDGLADFIVGAPLDDAAGFDAGSATVFSGADGSVLYRIEGDSVGDRLGHAVAGAGDANGDGYSDFAAGAPFDDDGAIGAGSVEVYSGRDGSLLHRFDGVGDGDSMGTALSFVGDVNADCHDDIAVAVPFYNGVNGIDSGQVVVHSGLDGSAILAFEGDGLGEALGWSVSGVGDLNADGHAEILIGAPLYDSTEPDSGRALVYSGIDGSELFSFAGQGGSNHFGWSVGSGGADLNADGVPDLLVGAPGPVSRPGTTWVYSGVDGRVLGQLIGKAAGDGFGWSVGGLGDANGDGFPDLVVGAPDDQSGTGCVAVYALPPYGSLVEVPGVAPAITGAHFGARLSRAGDVNEDGVEDYMVGAPLDFAKLGSVRVYSGADDSLIHLIVGSGLDVSFGIRLAPVGDLDQDGCGDLMVGAYHDDTFNQDSGVASVYSGKTGTLIRRFFGMGFRAHLGTAVGGLGDVDGDGVDDVFCGLGLADGEIGKGQALSGATGAVLYEVTAGNTGAWLGWDGTALGDVNGDGIGDFALGAPSGRMVPPGKGFVRIISGADGTQIKRLNGAFSRDRFGWIVSTAGDVNGDGVDDIIVGADGFDTEKGMEVGAATVYSGVDFTFLRTFTGELPGDFFGRSVAGAGDVNGDGYGDVLVGAPGADRNGMVDVGKAYLYSGFDWSLLQEFEGEADMDTLGSSLLVVPDSNGDGFAEVLLGVLLDDTSGADAGKVRRFETRPRSSPGSSWIYGPACAGSNGNLPRVGIDGIPVAGSTFGVTLSAAAENSVATLGFDIQQQRLDLAFLGLPQCKLLALHLLALPVPTDAMGKARLDIALAPGVVLPSVYGQWIVSDPAANPVGVVLSNAIQVSPGQ